MMENSPLLPELEQFSKEMFEKFVRRADKHGDRSVVKVGGVHLNEPGIPVGLLNHLMDEHHELLQAFGTNEQEEEAIDVANMAFLIWLQARKKNA